MATIDVLPVLRIALIDERSSDIITLGDRSTYAVVPGVNDVAMQISAPGYPIVNVPFTPGANNTYTCTDLGITPTTTNCCPLPDGIYSVTYTAPGLGASAVPVTIDQKFIKIDTIKCCFEKAFLKVSLECNCTTPEQDRYLKELDRIELYMYASVAECNAGNYKLSYDYYQRADKMLDKIKCRWPRANWKPCGCGC